jgi:hypothetical protein
MFIVVQKDVDFLNSVMDITDDELNMLLFFSQMMRSRSFLDNECVLNKWINQNKNYHD